MAPADTTTTGSKTISQQIDKFINDYQQWIVVGAASVASAIGVPMALDAVGLQSNSRANSFLRRAAIALGAAAPVAYMCGSTVIGGYADKIFG